ncbi:Tm-1-like ATP-binding domain-containing protein [Mesorhizobium comanense]|uniref:Tm-1-like ATP-binding domain-containing protein n=1 Tax=Mesorhizobium comanense TaxID=2502215 RepID=UPI0010F51883|nr:Tm-1-like ATP-binding domain-containing protein [Mesorhizobium comanense]
MKFVDTTTASRTDAAAGEPASAGASCNRLAAGLTPSVVVAATMDTKGEHVDFLRKELEERGLAVIVVDCGIRPAGPHRIDLGAEMVAEYAGTTIEAVRRWPERAPALAQMLVGIEACIADLQARRLLTGFIGLGGGTNASLAARAFKVLPYGVPKILVSTAVSGDTKPFIEGSDAVLIHPVVDFIGLNAPLRASLSRAAAAMEAMLSIPFWAAEDASSIIGVTAVGATTLAAETAAALFQDKGFGTYMFHARGPGGLAFEDLIAQGRIAAALDLATTEVTDEVVGGLRSAGPHRMEAAVAAGIPQVVIPGAVDLVNFSGPASVPERFRDRQLVSHTPSSTLMRTLPEESRQIGAWIGAKLFHAKGPASVFVPMAGFSSYDRKGSAFFDPRATDAFVEGISQALAARPDIRIETPDLHINDPAFVRGACERLLDHVRATS